MKLSSVIFLALTTCLLAACGDTTVKETLGLDRRAPDEFRVVSRPPLSVPPQFDLRPPAIDGVNAQPNTRDKAESLVLGNEQEAAKTGAKAAPVTFQPVSSAENVFLQKAGADQADPNVKKELTEKKINEQVTREEQGWWDRVTTLPGNKDPVVKAEEEAKRIEKNKEEGKPASEGDTPATGGGPISTLRHWLGDE